MPTEDPRSLFERFRFWILFAVTAALILVLGILAPQQMPLLPYKLALPMLGALDFFWLDNAVWPFAQPAGYLNEDWTKAGGDGASGEPDYLIAPGQVWPFILACLRQAIMVCCGALAVSLGL